jgi:hypothetical protein
VRSSLALAASLLAALAVAGCSGGETVALESVAHAADRTQSSGSSRMTMEITIGVDGKRMKVVADGAFDYKRARGWMEMDLGPLGALTDGAPPPRMTMLIEGDTIWMRVPPGMSAQTGGKPWARVSAGGNGLGMGVQNPDPSQLLDSLRGLTDSLEKRGRTNVRGVDTTHYRAHLDLQKAMAAARAREREEAQAMLQMFGGIREVPIDLYIDDADRVRRMELKYEFDVMDQKLEAEIKLELFDFGAHVAFKRPPAHQVAELAAPTS